MAPYNPANGGDAKGQEMILGLRTAIYRVGDLERAKEWYGAVLGKGPYFDEPFYVGFDVGGFELGLQPQELGYPASGGEGVVVYWGVEDADDAHARLLELGATERGGIQDVGGGIRIAAVLDPFGNVFGVIENPHFSLGGA
jgi:predicted enzyme related to lactoylglutathione lyase